MAFVTTLASDESFTTMSLTINFFRPFWEARLGSTRASSIKQQHWLCRVRYRRSRWKANRQGHVHLHCATWRTGQDPLTPSGRPRCENGDYVDDVPQPVSEARRSTHVSKASKAGHSACPQSVRLYSTFGGT